MDENFEGIMTRNRGLDVVIGAAGQSFGKKNNGINCRPTIFVMLFSGEKPSNNCEFRARKTELGL